MRQKNRLRALALSLALVLALAGCAAPEGVPGSGAASAPAPGSSSAAPEEPACTGPLYEVTVEDARECLPGFDRLYIDARNEFTEEYKARYMYLSGQIADLDDYRRGDFHLVEQASEEEQIAFQDELMERLGGAADRDEWERITREMGAAMLVMNSAISPEDEKHSSDIFFYAYSNSGDFVLYQGEDWDSLCLTNSKLMSFPALDQAHCIGTLSGRTLFCVSEEDGHFFFTDGDGQTVYTAPDNLLLWQGGAPMEYRIWEYGADGMLRVYQADKDRYCYMNMEDFSLLEIDEAYSTNGQLTRQGQTIYGAWLTTTFSEGLCPISYAESTDTLFHKKGGNGTYDFDHDAAEPDVAGYIDKTGALAIRFSELPQFEDQIVVDASDFIDGTAIVCRRPRQRTSGVSVPITELYAGDYCEIDTSGNILRECTEDDYWEHGGHGVITRMGDCYDMETIPADRVLVASDLVLYLNGETGQYELLDANGNVYPLTAPEHILAVRVLGNGLIFLCCGEPLDKTVGFDAMDFMVGGDIMTGTVTSFYCVRVSDIRPEGFVPDTAGFEPNALNIRDYDLPE